MSLRSFGIPLVLLGAGVALGVILDGSPARTSPAASAVAPLRAEATGPESTSLVSAGDETDPSPLQSPPQRRGKKRGRTLRVPSAAPDQAQAQPASEATVVEMQPDVAPQAAPDPEEEVTTYAPPTGEVPPPANDMYVPQDGEPPYEVVTTNPQACLPENSPGCETGAYCCADLVCVENSCVPTH